VTPGGAPQTPATAATRDDTVGLTVIAFTTTDVDGTQSASGRASHARCRVHRRCANSIPEVRRALERGSVSWTRG